MLAQPTHATCSLYSSLCVFKGEFFLQTCLPDPCLQPQFEATWKLLLSNSVPERLSYSPPQSWRTSFPECKRTTLARVWALLGMEQDLEGLTHHSRSSWILSLRLPKVFHPFAVVGTFIDYDDDWHTF